MRVKIGRYPKFFGTYQLAEKLLFWLDEDKDNDFERILSLSERLGKTFIGRWLDSFANKRQRYVSVRLDPSDTWSMDSTLAQIILPMLKQLKAQKHGSPMLEEFIMTSEGSSQRCFDFYKKDDDKAWDAGHKHWDRIMDEMIFAFEHIVDDSWEDEFYTGETDIDWKPAQTDSEGKPITFEMVHGKNHTYKCDYEGMRKVEERIQRGLELFGKHYQSLWS